MCEGDQIIDALVISIVIPEIAITIVNLMREDQLLKSLRERKRERGQIIVLQVYLDVPQIQGYIKSDGKRKPLAPGHTLAMERKA